MNVSRDSVLALQRHFLGALSAPARMWIEPLPAPRLAFAGSALRREGSDCVLDFGVVDTPGEERQLVRVFEPGEASVDVQLGATPAWLEAQWLDRRTLELRAAHDVEGEFHGVLRFVAGTRIEELTVRMTTRRAHPAARFDFNGSPVPRPFDFGTGSRPYALSIANDASAPLVVRFADLPAWLAFEVDGHRRGGPLPGRFFERAAPFVVCVTPQLVGRHDGVLRLQTNDPRPELQDVELRFSGCLEPHQPLVRASAPSALRLRANQTFTTQARLENWSRTPARTAKKAAPRGVALPTLPVVPSARDGQPGTATLPIRIIPRQLGPGMHTLSLALQVEDGDPAEVHVPVRVDVLPAGRGRAPWRGALLALLLLTIVIFVVRGLP